MLVDWQWNPFAWNPVALTPLLWAPLVVAFIADGIWKRTRRSSLGYLAEFSPGARSDLAYWLFYYLIQGGLLATLTPVGLVHQYVRPHVPQLVDASSRVPSTALWLALAGVAVLVVTDFARYWVHRLMHHSSFLWQFHAAHHAASEMTLLTGTRVTLTEVALNSFAVALVLTLIGLNTPAILVVLYARRFIDIVQHSNLGWTYGPFGRVLASPVNHRYHHSIAPGDWGANYGDILSVWDRMFGTYLPSMVTLDKRWSVDVLPDVGVDSSEQVRRTGIFSMPVFQDLHIWWMLLTRRSRRSKMVGVTRSS